MRSLLLVGLNEDACDLAAKWKESAEKLGLHVLGYAPKMGVGSSEPVEIFGITSYCEPGVWLESVDIVIPFLPTNAPESWQDVMADCSRLDREITLLRNRRNPMTEPDCCWIETIEPNDARLELKSLYNNLLGVHGKLHNLYRAFSLQPAPLEPADSHYRAVLHDVNLKSDPWFLELLSSQAATFAGCKYALANHGENFINLLGNRSLGERMLHALEERNYVDLFNVKQSRFLSFGEILCLRPHAVRESHIVSLREVGATDTEILECVQAIACFAYWTRFINGLGISLGHESIGRLDVDKV